MLGRLARQPGCWRPTQRSLNKGLVKVRFFTVVNQDKTIFVFGEPDDYKLAVPLPHLGVRVFSLSDRQKVSSFSENIKIEDLEVKSIQITDEDGAIISGSTKTEELLQHDWVLSINNVKYNVKSPATDGSARLTESHPKFQQVMSYFEVKAAEDPHLRIETYLEYCEDIGLDEEKARDILKTASQIGRVLYLDRNLEVDKIIFLRPGKITSNLDSMLDLPSLNQTQQEKIALLEKLRAELKPMQELSDICNERADTLSHRIATAGFVGLCTQFFLFARLTWWESDWDVMEPITWFTTVTETVLLGMFWFLWKGSEYAHMDLRHSLLSWQLKKQHRKRGFNPVAFKQLQAKISDLETEITFGKNHIKEGIN